MSAMPSYNSIIQQLIGGITAPSMAGQMQGAFGDNPIVKSFSGMMDQANQANASRGQNILRLLSGAGGATKQRNQQQYQSQLGEIDQDMMSKGLANTTVGNTLKAGAAQDLAQNNAAVDETSAMNLANMANSFTQKAPDMSMLADLLKNGPPRNTTSSNVVRAFAPQQNRSSGVTMSDPFTMQWH